jgi:hypothetical protein
MDQMIELEFIGSEIAMTIGRSKETFSSPWAGITQRIDCVGTMGKPARSSWIPDWGATKIANEMAVATANAQDDTIRSRPELHPPYLA